MLAPQALEPVLLPRSTAPPDEVAALIRGYARLRRVLPDGDQKTRQLQALVNQLLAMPLEEFDLVDEFHIRASPGERLAAILALVRRPDSRYLRWLSERLCVESPFVGYQAAVALRAAAQTLPQVDLDDVAEAVEQGCEFIKTDPRGGRSRMLGEALQIVAQRSNAA